VGDTGWVYGFDQSPEMLAQAREQAATADWRTVELFERDPLRPAVPSRAIRLP